MLFDWPKLASSRAQLVERFEHWLNLWRVDESALWWFFTPVDPWPLGVLSDGGKRHWGKFHSGQPQHQDLQREPQCLFQRWGENLLQGWSRREQHGGLKLLSRLMALALFIWQATLLHIRWSLNTAEIMFKSIIDGTPVEFLWCVQESMPPMMMDDSSDDEDISQLEDIALEAQRIR